MGECPYDAYYPYETQKKLDAANKHVVELEAEVVTLRRHVAAALTDYHDEKDRADKLEAENAKLRKDGGG